MSNWNQAPACGCWSCNRDCGGTVHPDSCGPAEAVDGNLICQACRESAQVFAVETSGRHGLAVDVDQDAVRLISDVYGSFNAKTEWLTAASARHLARLLTAAADDLDRLNAACWMR